MSEYKPTPREVWQRYISHRSELDPPIMDAIEQSGENGIICQDIEAKINRAHQAVSANLTRLAQRGIIEDNGYSYTKSGRRAKKWRIRNLSSGAEMIMYPGGEKPAHGDTAPGPGKLDTRWWRKSSRRLTRV